MNKQNQKSKEAIPINEIVKGVEALIKGDQNLEILRAFLSDAIEEYVLMAQEAQRSVCALYENCEYKQAQKALKELDSAVNAKARTNYSLISALKIIEREAFLRSNSIGYLFFEILINANVELDDFVMIRNTNESLIRQIKSGVVTVFKREILKAPIVFTKRHYHKASELKSKAVDTNIKIESRQKVKLMNKGNYQNRLKFRLASGKKIQPNSIASGVSTYA